MLIVGAAAPSERADATIYLSDEARGNVPIGRAAASILDYQWRQHVRATSPLIRFNQPDNLAEERALTPTMTEGILEFPLVGMNVAW